MPTLHYMHGHWDLRDEDVPDVKRQISTALTSSGFGWVSITTDLGQTAELFVTPGVPIFIDPE